MIKPHYSLTAAALAGTALVLVSGSELPEPIRPVPSALRAAYMQAPLAFETDGRSSESGPGFITRGPGYALQLSPGEARFLVAHRPAPARPASAAAPSTAPASAFTVPAAEIYPLRIQLAGANPGARLRGSDPLAGVSHYLRGNDPRRWRTHVRHYARVEAEEVYPGIDLIYYGKQGQLEYDFVVAPGADPSRIGLRFTGARDVALAPTGDLILNTPAGELRQKRPFVYQEVAGRRREIAAHYVLAPGTHPPAASPSTVSDPPAPAPLVRLALADYDRTQPLVIDPVLAFSTYLGGGANDGGVSVAVDESGSAYVAGSTLSLDFPTALPLQDELGGDGVRVDTFISKLVPSGNGLVYSTYLGGGGNDFPHGIAVDGQGQACIAGDTDSTDFPTLAPFQPRNAGEVDTFVAKLQADGAGFVFSTYLGGRGTDLNGGVATDADGAVYVTGTTDSTNFPTANAYQNQIAGGQYDAYVTKLNPTGSALAYSTYLGGTKQDFPGTYNSIAVDAAGGACIVGTTFSTNFPLTAGAPDSTYGSDLLSTEMFVSRLSPGGDALTFSTYLGGTGSDTGRSIAVDGLGHIAVTGNTRATDFPTLNALRTSHAGGALDAIVARFDPAGSTTDFSTYLGGSSNDFGEGVAADSVGNVYVTGETFSVDFPVSAPLQPNLGSFDAFVTKISANGARMVYSTYLGGASQDTGIGITVGLSSTATVTGRTLSANFPVFRAIQPTAGGGGDAFVTRMVEGVAPPAVPSTLEAVSPCSTQALLSWTDNSDNEDAFEVERRTEGAGPAVFLPVGAVEADTRTFEDRGLTRNTTYTYRVRATNRDGASGYTNEVQVTTPNVDPPNPPQDVAVEALSHQSLKLTWTDTSTGETGFKIERAAETGAFLLIATTPANAITFEDSGLTAATAYRYRVRATNGGCDSAYSSIVSGTTKDSPPTTPTGFTARGASDSEINLSWIDTSTNETGFKIERKRGNDPFAPIAVAAADATSYLDRTLSPSTNYTYRIRSTNDNGDSPPAEAVGTTLAIARGKIKVPVTVNFGTVALGTLKAKDITISNISRNEVLRVSVGPAAEPFGIVSGGGTSILIIGGRQRLTLRFQPTIKGRHRSSLFISSTDPRKPSVKINLIGRGK